MEDHRFSALASDPRYRFPSRKQARTAVDPRFRSLFVDPDFSSKASVDRYGRKVRPDTSKKEIKRLYRLNQERKPREVVGSSDEDSEVADGDEILPAKHVAREGFSQSSSEEESASGGESDDEAALAEETAGQEHDQDLPTGEVSRRIAAVNLDWDNIRASDILAVASSFVPSVGRIESVTVYPSEFGRERMEREELEGPPRELFASPQDQADDENDGEDDSSDSADDEKIKRQLIESQAEEGEKFDTTKLRQYQLQRLRYYYAVIVCDSEATAKVLYDSMDGREYLASANFFDLRFIPNETSFDDDQPRDKCTQLPAGYKPNDFRTEALTHSNVRLTWDDDDKTRKEIQKRAFSRAEMDENDLQAYLGSESSDAESIASRRSAAEDRRAKKRDAQRAKMRAALGMSDEPIKSKKDKDEFVGDMQITFTPALGGRKDGASVFENEPMDEISTRERYIRKEKERKQKRKDKMKAGRAGNPVSEEDKGEGVGDNEDRGFGDPFFTDPALSAAAEKKAKKADRIRKHAEQEATDAGSSARRAELELLMAEDQEDDLRHFDMREIERAEKDARRRSKKRDREEPEARKVDEGFEVETKDPRFQALFESHEYAIDPTNPRFKRTKGMIALLDEGRKKRKHVTEVENEHAEGSTKTAHTNGNTADEELQGLVKRLKGKSKD